MGDYFIFLFLVVIIGGVMVYALTALASKNNKGTWDERSRIRGKMRTKRWKVSDTVPNLKEFLLQGDVESAGQWPAAGGAPGVQAVTNTRELSWRSAILPRTASSTLFFTFDIPQRADGSEAALPEMLLPLTGERSAAAADLLGAQAYAVLLEWPEAVSAHLCGERVTVEFSWQLGEDPISHLELCSQQAGQFISQLPAGIWK
ncbi:MAG: hypothetical protein Q4E03_05120 [Trueperella sp.]|nr:hypothetical protein [Trueperella sp.]